MNNYCHKRLFSETVQYSTISIDKLEHTSLDSKKHSADQAELPPVNPSTAGAGGEMLEKLLSVSSLQAQPQNVLPWQPPSILPKVYSNVGNNATRICLCALLPYTLG